MPVINLYRQKTLTKPEVPIVQQPKPAFPKHKRVVILAGGIGRRWKNYLGTSKHMAVVHSEPLLKRTIRLLKEQGIADIWLVVRRPGQFGDLGVQEYITTASKYSIDRIYGARDLAPCTYLFGDVYFTEEAIRTILNDKHDYRFFGRRFPSRLKTNREIYAVKANDFIIQKASEMRQMQIERKITNSLAGHLLIYCLGYPINPRARVHTATTEELSPISTDIDDETTDFDLPKEYDNFIKLYDPPKLVISQRGPKYKRTTPVINYYPIDRLAHDLIHEFLPRMPEIDLVVGIPRDGILIAYLISIYRGIPFTDLDSFIEGRIYRQGIKHRKSQQEIKSVLVVDDICASGTAMKEAKSLMKPNGYEMFYGAVYASHPDDKLKSGLIDCYGCTLYGPRHYQWTHCDAFHLPQTMMDIDGVLCPDWDGKDDSGQSYVEWLESVPLKIRPRNVGTLITWRREEHRAITEAWLERHGITYNNLIMCDRSKWANAAEFKAHYYQNSKCRLFVESSHNQAKKIHELTARPVISFDTNEGFGV